MGTVKTYDALNRLVSISTTNAAAEVVSSHTYAYNQANQRTQATLADGSYWVYEYDALGQVVSGRRYGADGTPVAGQQFEYRFDDIGNRKSAGKGGNEWGVNLRYQNYTGNDLNQYTERTVPGYVDVLGRAHSNATVTVCAEGAELPVRAGRHGDYFRAEVALDNSGGPVYAALTNLAVLLDGANPDITTNAVKHALLPPAVETYTHDDDGNLTTNGLWTYTWNGENRLIAMESVASLPDAAKYKLTFQYDPEGRRVSKVVYTWTGVAWFLSKWHRYAYDGWNLVADMEVRNGVTNTYTWGLDLSGTLQGAGGVGGLLLTTDYGPPTTSHFVAYDGNGNVMALVDADDSTVTAQYAYGPFGELIRATGPMAEANPFRFSTKYRNPETGLYYYGYRYYDPVTGRWLSRDPIRENGFLSGSRRRTYRSTPSSRLYAFANNRPTDHIDMTGLEVWTFCCAEWTPRWTLLYGRYNGQGPNKPLAKCLLDRIKETDIALWGEIMAGKPNADLLVSSLLLAVGAGGSIQGACGKRPQCPNLASRLSLAGGALWGTYTAYKKLDTIADAGEWCMEEACTKFVPRVRVVRRWYNPLRYLCGKTCLVCPEGTDEVKADNTKPVWRKGTCK